MKHFSLLLLFLSFFSCSYAQGKKTVFYNEKGSEISEAEFHKQQDNRINLDIYIETDTLMTGLLVERKRQGQLGTADFESLKKSLSPQKDLSRELIVILYYPGKDNCNARESKSPWNVFDREYQRRLRSIAGFDHFWIYKDKENLKYYHPKLWQLDQGQLVEHLFFQQHYPCFSFVVVDQKGRYISYFGEFGTGTVWELAQELKNKAVSANTFDGQD